jgi:hypothetical protein
VTRIDPQSEHGAVGWLLIGIVIGVILVFWAVFSLIF